MSSIPLTSIQVGLNNVGPEYQLSLPVSFVVDLCIKPHTNVFVEHIPGYAVESDDSTK